MRIAIVTGATSGMGREFVMKIDRYYRNLDEIWVIGRRTKRMQELQKHVNKPLRILSLDLQKKKDRQAYLQLIDRKKPKVAVLVNSAGFGKVGDYNEISVIEQTNMIELNCKALTYVTLTTLPYMVKGSHIIQMASAAAFLPQTGFAVYAATKAYVLSFSRALNIELRKRRISVTAVCPGPVKTEFFEVAEETGQVYQLKKIFMVNKRDVVEKAFDDAIKRRSVSVYSLPMKGLRVIGKVVPHGILLRAMRLIK